jgi:hypothetical protein
MPSEQPALTWRLVSRLESLRTAACNQSHCPPIWFHAVGADRDVTAGYTRVFLSVCAAQRAGLSAARPTVILSDTRKER